MVGRTSGKKGLTNGRIVKKVKTNKIKGKKGELTRKKEKRKTIETTVLKGKTNRITVKERTN